MLQTPEVQREGPWAHAVIPNPNANDSFYYVFPQGPHFSDIFLPGKLY